MKSTNTHKVTTNLPKRLTIWAGIVTAILSIPLILNAPWTGLDYTAAGVVLYGSAVIFEVTTQHMNSSLQKFLVGFTVCMFIVFFWAWAVA